MGARPMRLTKQSGYAVRIVMECAMAGERLTRIADIAKRYDITKHNVAKTVPILVRHGIIEGVRGRNGGIRLARPATEITVGEIVRASEATHIVADGFEADTAAGGKPSEAPINQMLDAALEAFISVLDKHTVADMISGRKSIGDLAGGTETAENDGDASTAHTSASCDLPLR